MNLNRHVCSPRRVFVVLVVAAISLFACDPGTGEGTDGGVPAGADGGAHGTDASGSPRDSGNDAGALVDGDMPDIAETDSGRPDGGLPDAGIPEDTGADGGSEDAGTIGDAGSTDSGQPPEDVGFDSGTADAGVPDTGTVDAGFDAGSSDAAGGDTGSADGGAVYGWRKSLEDCWTDAACQRVMAVAHGGAWDAISAPYLSNAALAKAYDLDIDGVKIDVRVSKDNIPVLAHSSPIEFYESVLCSGKKIEEMTAAEVTNCLRAPSLTEKFQRLDDVLGYLRDKMVVQLCVKQSEDYQRTIEELNTLGAGDFAFIEIDSAAELQNIIPTLAGADTVWYLVNVSDRLNEVDTLISVIKNPRAFMYEFEPTVDVSTLTPAKLHPAGVRSFTYDSTTPLMTAKIQTYFENGFDVVSTQNAANAVAARRTVNTARGISPP